MKGYGLFEIDAMYLYRVKLYLLKDGKESTCYFMMNDYIVWEAAKKIYDWYDGVYDVISIERVAEDFIGEEPNES